MNILGFDTSASACSIALLVNNKITVVHEVAPLQQAKTILPLIEELLKTSHLALSDLNAIAFGCGPGSFTGIRIASCVAQGLGFASQIPLIPISSLAILAQTAYEQQGWKHNMVAIDARMNKIYWALYQVKGSIVTLLKKELLCTPVDITLPSAGDWYGVGDGWRLFADILTKQLAFQPKQLNPSLLPQATALITLAQAKLQSGEGIVAPAAALPSYLS